MARHVNFESLRSVTGGDADLEAQLFRAFLTSAADCLSGLRRSCEMRDDASWKSQAHALKGLCLNLGAGDLGELSKQAQDEFQASWEEKRKMLGAMESELAKVEEVIRPLT